jgi:pyroglutamyl-peptidase
METILLTGFGPFGAHETNVSQQAVERLDGLEHSGFRVRSLVLPVQFERAVAALEEAVLVEQPAALIACGIVGDADRVGFRVELAAVNDRSYTIPDADGVSVAGEAVEEGGPAQVFSTLPVSAIKQAWDREELCSELSEDAGRYLCNSVFYWGARRVTPAGFLHVPADPNGLEDVVRAIDLALEATASRLAAQRVEAATA